MPGGRTRVSSLATVHDRSEHAHFSSLRMVSRKMAVSTAVSAFALPLLVGAAIALTARGSLRSCVTSPRPPLFAGALVSPPGWCVCSRSRTRCVRTASGGVARVCRRPDSFPPVLQLFGCSPRLACHVRHLRCLWCEGPDIGDAVRGRPQACPGLHCEGPRRVGLDAARPRRKTILKLVKRIQHRGPDWSSLHADGENYLAHQASLPKTLGPTRLLALRCAWPTVAWPPRAVVTRCSWVWESRGAGQAVWRGPGRVNRRCASAQ